MTEKYWMGRRLFAAALLVGSLVIIGGVLFSPPFTIYNKSRDRVVYRIPVERVREIRYVYRQSYDRGIIEEYFVMEGKRMVPTVMTYDTDSYDYHGSRYPQAERHLVAGRWHVTIHEHPGYPSISYRVGYTIEQHIRLLTTGGERNFSFSDLGEPGDLLVVGAEKR